MSKLVRLEDVEALLSEVLMRRPYLGKPWLERLHALLVVDPDARTEPGAIECYFEQMGPTCDHHSDECPPDCPRTAQKAENELRTLRLKAALFDAQTSGEVDVPGLHGEPEAYLRLAQWIVRRPDLYPPPNHMTRAMADGLLAREAELVALRKKPERCPACGGKRVTSLRSTCYDDFHSDPVEED